MSLSNLSFLLVGAREAAPRPPQGPSGLGQVTLGGLGEMALLWVGAGWKQGQGRDRVSYFSGGGGTTGASAVLSEAAIALSQEGEGWSFLCSGQCLSFRLCGDMTPEVSYLSRLSRSG